MRHRSCLAAVAAGVALALAGCGASTESGEAPTSTAATAAAHEHNEADVAFLQGMIPHHEQAVVMSQMAADQAGSAEVRDLAERIEAAQAPEMDQMSAWLESWGEEVPDAHDTHDGHGGGHGDHDAAGMLTADDMAALHDADGEAWDEMFLTGMIAHHEGAVEMAETQLAQGSDPKVLELAQAVIDGQTAEIEEMRGLLAETAP